MNKLIMAVAVLVSLLFAGAANADALTWTASATGDSSTITSIARWSNAAIYYYSLADSKSATAIETVRVRVTATGAATQFVTLTETAAGSGIFRAAHSMAPYAAGSQVVVDTGINSLLSCTVVISLSGADSISWKDAGCTVTQTTFPRYGTAYVSLTDSHANTSPTVINSTTVRVRGGGVDTTVVTLLESGANTNIFTGSVSLAAFAAGTVVTVDTGIGYLYQGSATITLTGADSIVWQTTAGGATCTAPARFATVYVQLTDSHANTHYAAADTIAVRIRYNAADTVALTLVETGLNTNIFSAEYQLTNALSTSVTVDTGLGYAVQGSLTTLAITSASAIGFYTDARYVDAATEYVSSHPVFISYTNEYANTRPTVADTVTARLINTTSGVTTSVVLLETAVSSSIFRYSATVTATANSTITIDTGAGALRTASASVVIWPVPTPNANAMSNVAAGPVFVTNGPASPGNVQISDGTHTAAIDDAGFLVTLDAAHSRVHSGIYYSYDELNADADNGETFAVIMKSATDDLHTVFSVTSTLSGYARLYEGVVCFDTGTQDTSVNFKRDEEYVSNIKFYTAPGIVSYGPLLSVSVIGGGVANNRIGGQAREATEWLLKPNTYYVIEFVSLADNNVAVIDVEYYESNL